MMRIFRRDDSSQLAVFEKFNAGGGWSVEMNSLDEEQTLKLNGKE